MSGHAPWHQEPPPIHVSARILVVDDQRNMRLTTAMLLRQAGHRVQEASNGEEALAALEADTFELLLTDLRMEPMDGVELLSRALQVQPSLQIIVMTAYGTIENAVEAIRLGAADYVTKPFQEGELEVRIAKALEKHRLLHQVHSLAGEFRSRYGLDSIVGESAPVREMIARILRIAPTPATVLITGESGTGKELVARAIHTSSARAHRPFIPVNCAAISPSLLESELFGHAKGAFTGAVRARRGLYEEAEGGSLFLDEIGETDVLFQAKLLRALQESEVRRVGESQPIYVDVRVIAATNQDLREAISERRFREDLYYRLNVMPIRVPPLRERLSDIPILAQHFLTEINGKAGTHKRFADAALDKLQGHDYPGNVRELRNLVEQAALLSLGDRIDADDFDLEPESIVPAAAASSEPGPVRLAEIVEEAEREAILHALERHQGEMGSAARDLGISTTTLWRKRRRLGILAD